MAQQCGTFGVDKGKMENQIRQIILTQPGIRAIDITILVSRSKGRVSQVIKKLTDKHEVEAFRDRSRRGLSLRPTGIWVRRSLLRTKWGKDWTAKLTENVRN